MTQSGQQKAVRDAIEQGFFCTLATSSAENRPHVVGVVYVAVDGILYINTTDTGTKARNIRENRRVAVCIPVQQHPEAPPFCVQFQGTAEICSLQDARIVELMARGRLESIAGHGVLDLPGSCFLRVTPGSRIATYGIGVSLEEVMRDPVHASRSVVMS